MPKRRSKKDSKVEERRRGRPPKYDKMPPPIPDTPENIADAVLKAKPKKSDEWRYLNP